jgi:hypothetical protein
MATKKLFKVTMREANNKSCTREVHVVADSMDRAGRRAKHHNPHGLWSPQVIAVELLDALVL